MKRTLWVAAALLCAFGLGRAAMHRFQEKEQAFRAECQAELKKLGVPRDQLKAKYPTPSISMINTGCLLPGGTAEVLIKGKFAPNTKFIFQNDNIEVVKESLLGNEYRATVKAAAGIPPQSAGVVVITPVTAISTRQENAVVVGGRYEWTINAANGWKIVARSPANKACSGSGNQTDVYDMAFYRNGEANPFEKRSATLYTSVFDKSYRFNVDESDQSMAAPQQQMESLMKQFSDPKLTDAQRDQLMKKLEQIQQQMTAAVTKMSDPAYQKKVEEARLSFGCRNVNLAGDGPQLKGSLHCADKVGSRIAVDATVALLGK